MIKKSNTILAAEEALLLLLFLVRPSATERPFTDKMVSIS